MSIKFKIALLFTILASLLLAASGLVIYLFTAQERTTYFNNRIKNKALSTANLATGITNNDYSLLKKYDTSAVTSLYNKGITIIGSADIPVYQYVDGQGDSIYLSDEQIEATKINETIFFDYKGRKAVALHIITPDQNFIVTVAARDRDGEIYLYSLKKIIIWAIAITMILTFCAGWFFARWLVRPIKHIVTELGLISSNNLSQRIQTGSSKDELALLANTCNLLLDRLQESFILQRRFISNASHELSTPLTSISSQLEVTLQNPRTEQEYQAVLLSVYEDIKDLQHLTKSLLDIAKAGTEGSIELSEVRIDEVLWKVAADVQKLKDTYHVTIDIAQLPDEEKYLTVFGNENLLYVALKNVIENGCKYAYHNNTTVQAVFEKKAIIIRVISQGDVISEADREQIFQPFFRTENARNKEGFGLGLTLAKRILALHKAPLAVTSNPQTGTVFTIEIGNTA